MQHLPPTAPLPPLPPLSESERRMLDRDPRLAGRRRVLGIIGGAFLVSVFIYAGLALFMPPTPQQPEVPLWLVLLLVSVMEIPAQFFVIHILTRQGGPIRNFEDGNARGSSLFIVAMAFPSAIAVYGLVIHLALGGPAFAPWIFFAISLLWMTWTFNWGIKKALNFMYEGLQRENQGRM